MLTWAECVPVIDRSRRWTDGSAGRGGAALRVTGEHLLVDAEAPLGASPHSSVVNMVQAEAEREAFGPLKVVYEGPIRVATHVNAAVDCVAHGLQHARQVARALSVWFAVVRHARLGDVDREIRVAVLVGLEHQFLLFVLYFLVNL